MDFAGGAALQVVRERPLRRYAGIYDITNQGLVIEIWDKQTNRQTDRQSQA